MILSDLLYWVHVFRGGSGSSGRDNLFVPLAPPPASRPGSKVFVVYIVVFGGRLHLPLVGHPRPPLSVLLGGLRP